MKQAVVAYTDDLNAVTGKIALFSKFGEKWRMQGDSFEGSFGSNGLVDKELKREGDGKSPQGVFRLGKVYGHSAKPRLPVRMDYECIIPGLEAVDDPKSKYYNQIVNKNVINSPDWNSSERMSEIEVYELAVFVQYNWPNPIPHKGSAIFLHRWSSVNSTTGGCTAMDFNHLEKIVAWLNPAYQPGLIQGTKAYVSSILGLNLA